jgi:hypothetical protein
MHAYNYADKPKRQHHDEHARDPHVEALAFWRGRMNVDHGQLTQRANAKRQALAIHSTCSDIFHLIRQRVLSRILSVQLLSREGAVTSVAATGAAWRELRLAYVASHARLGLLAHFSTL